MADNSDRREVCTWHGDIVFTSRQRAFPRPTYARFVNKFRVIVIIARVARNEIGGCGHTFILISHDRNIAHTGGG